MKTADLIAHLRSAALYRTFYNPGLAPKTIEGMAATEIERLQPSHEDAERFRWMRGTWTYAEWSKALGRECNSPKDINVAIDKHRAQS